MEFDWDDPNQEHIAQHDIDPDEAEDAVLDEDALDFPTHRGPKWERRFGVLGKALSGRVLILISEERKNKFRVVTAQVAEKRSERDKEKQNPK